MKASLRDMLKYMVCNLFPFHIALLKKEIISLILHILYNSIHTTSILSSPFYMHTSFLTCLCISSYSSAQALTVSSNITPTCVKNTLVKIWLKRDFSPTKFEYIRFENTTFLGGPLLSMWMK